MLALWSILSVVVLGFSFYLWPRDQRSLKTVIITGTIISSLTALGILIAKSIPITRKETVEKVVVLKYKKPPQIVYKDKIVYRVPGQELAAVNPDDVCTGKIPTEVLVIDVSTKEKDATTWMITRPVGRLIKVTCYVSGDLSNFWKVGDIVQLRTGKAQ